MFFESADFVLNYINRYDSESIYSQLFFQTYLLYMLIHMVHESVYDLLEDENLWDFCDNYIQDLFDDMDNYLMLEDEYFEIKWSEI